MRVVVTHRVDVLARDFRQAPAKVGRKVAAATRSAAAQGNRLAKKYARQSAAAHGKDYPDTFSTEMHTPLDWEYGPEARGQGLLARILNDGSPTSPAHNDLEKSMDVITPKWRDDVGDALDGTL